MPDLNFSITKAEPVPFAASPMIGFTLDITDAGAGESPTIHSVALRCQIRIEPAQRRYEPDEKARLIDLYGEPSRWGQTLQTMLWAHTSVIVPPFERSTTVDLPVPCTFDFNIASAKYFHALEGGEVPLTFLFSGTIFHQAEQGMQIAQIPWDKEAKFRLPVQTWKKMMDVYYPNSAWLCLRRDAFEQFRKFKSRHGIATWEEAIERLVAEDEVQA